MKNIMLIAVFCLISPFAWTLETSTSASFDVGSDVKGFEKALSTYSDIQKLSDKVYLYKTKAFIGTQEITYTLKSSTIICSVLITATEARDLRDLKNSFYIRQLSFVNSIKDQVALSKMKGDSEFYPDKDAKTNSESSEPLEK